LGRGKEKRRRRRNGPLHDRKRRKANPAGKKGDQRTGEGFAKDFGKLRKSKSGQSWGITVTYRGQGKTGEVQRGRQNPSRMGPVERPGKPPLNVVHKRLPVFSKVRPEKGGDPNWEAREVTFGFL